MTSKHVTELEQNASADFSLRRVKLMTIMNSTSVKYENMQIAIDIDNLDVNSPMKVLIELRK